MQPCEEGHRALTCRPLHLPTAPRPAAGPLLMQAGSVPVLLHLGILYRGMELWCGPSLRWPQSYQVPAAAAAAAAGYCCCLWWLLLQTLLMAAAALLVATATNLADWGAPGRIPPALHRLS